jgi:endonuclease-3
MNSKIALMQLGEIQRLGKSPRLAAEGWDKEWKILIATLLSARTRDETTIKISERLFQKYPNVRNLGKAKLKDVELMIKPVNFYKTKAKHIIKSAKIIDKKYGGKLPKSAEELMKLPGVGRKTANVFLAEGGKQVIGVDTHVGYISKYLGWTKNTNPNKVEDDLKKIFPEKNWRSINYILVKFGKTYTSRKQKNKLLDDVKKIN